MKRPVVFFAGFFRLVRISAHTKSCFRDGERTVGALQALVSQSGTAKGGHGGRRTAQRVWFLDRGPFLTSVATLCKQLWPQDGVGTRVLRSLVALFLHVTQASE